MKHQQDILLQLLDSSAERLLALLMRLTLRADIAEELMQDLFIKLNNVNNLHKINNLYAYACRTAVNLAVDWRRSQKKNPQPLDQVPELTGGVPSPYAKLIQDEQIEQILDASTLLTPLLRDAFVMRYIQQESYETIAGQLGKTPHQVRALCHKAVTRLRDIINQKSPLTGQENSHGQNR